MSKTTFTPAELLILQLVLINHSAEYLLPRFPILSEDELNKTIQEMLKKISHMFIAPDDPALHPLAVNREIFDKHHDKIKGALEIVDGENPVTAENQAIFDLLDVIGELCGKELTSPYKP